MPQKRAVVDIQGFTVPQFEAREFTLIDLEKEHSLHLFLKPGVAQSKLTNKSSYSALLMERYHHKLPHNGRWITQMEGLKLIKDAASKYKIIYVKDNQQKSYLERIKARGCLIIDLNEEEDDFYDVPKFYTTTKSCWFH